ncbi:hypothetical protein LK994_08825 [Ferruginibacter lapsinanis]|uniref:hypothetical protein n=1 Tax=Ferruginibacter lapsinanis TaxID=563172 RepID=UPI001E2F3004|nr:hypothetical protein [Ferruginibacter lapsinanis]UEG48739.1 hypothetical protein LK994_08825 [Ferruginibacter lapsinanis]
MKRTIGLVVCFLAAVFGYSQTSADRSLDVSVTSTNAPLSFTLRWKKGLNAQSYSVSRKGRTDSSWTLLTSSLGMNDTFYIDNTVTSGIGYEYNIKATSSIAPFSAYSYVYCASKLPVKHSQGKIILLVDSNYINPLFTEISRLEIDLINEGWIIVRKDIGRNQSVRSVKQFIVSTYLADTQKVKGIFILGHIPVPYSGLIAPDGHDDHVGAWPTDAYYCDTSFTYWTDISVNDITASRAENKNIPGDGKFDQSFINTRYLKLFSGRVDVYNMPAINSNDTFLLKQYLDKNHTYRTVQKKFRMRGLITDNFGYFDGEAFAQNGWRNFNTLLTSDSVSTGNYSLGMINNDYLWSYACGAGGYQSAGGIGNTSLFKTTELQSVFTMMFGSYFGDWDNQDNFLRAPLAGKSNILVNCWAGRPNWFFHHMAMGEPIGADAFESSINRSTYAPSGYGMQMIHTTLLGDPTLKMYVYEPPTNLTITNISGSNYTGLRVSWTPSTSPDVLGYYVYKAKSLADTFQLLNSNYTTGTAINDFNATIGNNIYMVRAVKLQTSTTGSFYNLSRGIMDSATLLSIVPVTVNYFNGQKTVTGNKLKWSMYCSSAGITAEVQKSSDAIHFTSIYTITADNIRCQQPFDFTDLQNISGLKYYRLKLIEANQQISFSNIIALDNTKRNVIDIKTNSALTNRNLLLTIASIEKAQLKITITDVSGKLLKINTIVVSPGDNQIIIDCANLPAGIYNFSCFSGSHKLCVSRFIKQ